MDKLTIKAIQREKGKSARNRLRREGYIPAILYGPDTENQLIAVKSHDILVLLAHGFSESKIINMDINGTTHQTIIKEIQRDPVKGKPISVDFYKIEKAHPITIEVPIHFTGKAAGVEKGGVLEHHLTLLEIETLPANLPEAIDIDISNLDIGDHLTVADLVLPKDIKVLNPPETIVVSVVPPTVEAAAPEAAQAAETAATEEKEEAGSE